MPDLERIQRDKATILSIIKYAMIILIAAGVVYYGFRLVWILFPFVIGFILAKVAGNLAKAWLAASFHIKNRKIRLRLRQAGKVSRKSTRAGNAGQPENPDNSGYSDNSDNSEIPDLAAQAAQAALAAQAAKAAVHQAGRRKKGLFPQGLARSRREIRLALVFYFLEVIAVIGLVIGVIIGSISQLRSLANYLPVLVRSSDLSHRLSDYLVSLSDRLGGIFQADFLKYIENELVNLQQKLVQAMPGIVSGILGGLGAFIGYLPILFFIVVVIIMSGYYFIVDSRNLYLFLRRNITSKTFREKSVRLVNSLSTTLFRVIGGYLLLLTLTFVEALAGLLVIQMPYAVIIALVAAIVDFLPVLGISATLIPVAVYMFINGNIFGGLGALVLLGIMTLIRRVIEPAIMGNAMSLHPMATLAAMIIAIALYGLSGIIIGPIILVIAREVMSLFGFDQKIRRIIGDILNKVSS